MPFEPLLPPPPVQMTDLVHNAATYDMRNKEDLSDQGITVETLFKDRDNQWWVCLRVGQEVGFWFASGRKHAPATPSTYSKNKTAKPQTTNQPRHRGDGTPKDRSSAAVDAHYGASVTLTYYKDVHGRNGVDGRGGQVKSRVHLSKAYDNAYCGWPLAGGAGGRGSVGGVRQVRDACS
jgi:hypothetical protein